MPGFSPWNRACFFVFILLFTVRGIITRGERKAVARRDLKMKFAKTRGFTLTEVLITVLSRKKDSKNKISPGNAGGLVVPLVASRGEVMVPREAPW